MQLRALLIMALVAISALQPALAETYWLDETADQNTTHYGTKEEACIVGYFQERIEELQASNSFEYSFFSNVGPDQGIGEVVCRGTISRRTGTGWIPVELVDTLVYGPYGSLLPCLSPALRDPDTGQCGVPKCDRDCPISGGNKSNPIDSATGNKRQREIDYVGSGIFPLRFERTYNSHRIVDNQAFPVGTGWTHNYNARIAPIYANGGALIGVYVYRPNGAIQRFSYSGSIWSGDPDVTGRFSGTVNNGALVAGAYRTPDDTVETYDGAGKLTTITNRDGLVQSLSYTTTNGQSRYVQKVIDPEGRTLIFGYTGSTLTSITDGAGASIGFAYANGDLVSATYPDVPGTKVRTYHYNESGQTGGLSQPHLLTGITDEESQRHASWGYDTARRGVLSVLGDYATGTANRTTLQFGVPIADKVRITDALSQARDYGFTISHRDARLGDLNAPCDNCQNVAKTKTYDANGFPNVTTDFRDTTTDQDFDARGLELQRVEAASDTQGRKRTLQTDWHPTLRVPTERRLFNAASALVVRTNWTHNIRGQTLTESIFDPVTSTTRTTTWTYCEQGDVDAGICPFIGLVRSVNGPRTDVSDLASYAYRQADESTCVSSPATCPYRKGDLWKVTDANGRVTEMLRYDGAGRLLSMKDENGVVLDMEYHPRGWMTARKHRGTNDAVETDDLITRIDYWGTGLVKQITQPDGAFTHYLYDAAHRLTDISDNAGNTIHYALNGAGNRAGETTRDSGNVLRRTLSRVYNQLGRLEVERDASNDPTSHLYDNNGNLDTTTDALGKITEYDFDPLNRLARTLGDVSGIAAETELTYDAQDNLTRVNDPKNLNTDYSYNGFSDLTGVISPDTGSGTYTYDRAGNRKTQVDARSILTSYSYDALNRMTGITYPNTSLNVSYAYDTATKTVCTVAQVPSFPVGRLASMTDASGVTSYCYDRFGRVVLKKQTTNGLPYSVKYTYTKAGHFETIRYPDDVLVDYVRDGQGRITEVGLTRPGSPREVVVTGVSHHPFGPPSGWTYANGRMLVRALDLDYRPEFVDDANAGGLTLGYEFNAVGNLTRLYDADRVVSLARYRYDGLNRLEDVRDGPTDTLIEHYGYDDTGNRTDLTHGGTTVNYGYPAGSHRLSSVGSVARGYDNSGNTTSIGGTTQEFVYDDTNRMQQVKAGGVATMNYAYNGKGEQVRRYLGSSSTTTVYDEAGRWLGDYSASAFSPIQQVIWLDDLPIAVLDGANSARKLHYIEPDHLGTPRVVIDPVRNVPVWAWALQGEVFGDTPPNQDPDSDGTLFVLNMRYPGQRYDAASGLNYNYFREYEPDVGRYAQSDPIGLLGGISTYSYSLSQPTQTYDRFGLHPATVGAAVVLGAIQGCGGGCFGAVVGDYGACVIKSRFAGGKTLGQCSDECTPDPCEAMKSCVSGCIAGAILGGASAGRGVALTPFAGYLLNKYFRFLFSPDFCAKYGIPAPPKPTPIPLPDWLRNL